MSDVDWLTDEMAEEFVRMASTKFSQHIPEWFK